FCCRRICFRSSSPQTDYLSHRQLSAWRLAAPDWKPVVPLAGRFCSGRFVGAAVVFDLLLGRRGCSPAGSRFDQRRQHGARPRGVGGCGGGEWGVSGAVAGLMGAFLVRFPKMKIEMRWILGIRSLLRGGYQFSAPAWTLLPLWLLTEIFYGSLVGHASGVAHWAHVGGFVFGALIALAFRFTGLEHLANKAVEEKVSWVVDPEIQQATELMEKGQNDEAIALLRNLLAAKPESVDACSLLQQISWRKGDVPAYHELTAQLCALHLKTRENDLAWQNYEEFLSTGGENMPAGTWLDLCRVAESKQDFERAVAEYQKVAAAYPSDKRSLQAMIAAGRICSKQLNRPDDALKFYEAAKASPIPHLDWEQTIESAIREARKNSAAAPALAAVK